MSSHVMPERRDLQFTLPTERISDWNNGNVQLSQFMNTLSLFFPEGERMFIDAVRNCRDQVSDPELKKAMTAFIGQEAMHGREHEEYNEVLFNAVPSTRAMERGVGKLLGVIKKRAPVPLRLSATIALEHFTAIMADGLLREQRLLEGADPNFAAIWNWHALEETEHKAVAFDVWDQVMGRGPAAYALRAGGMIFATVVFWSLVFPFFLKVLYDEGKLLDKGWGYFFRCTLGEYGYLRKLVLPWAEYFRPNFHPWDQDNSAYLQQIPELAARYTAPAAQKAAA